MNGKLQQRKRLTKYPDEVPEPILQGKQSSPLGPSLFQYYFMSLPYGSKLESLTGANQLDISILMRKPDTNRLKDCWLH